MLDSIPDLQRFVRHSFTIHTSEGKRQVSVKKAEIDPVIANHHIIKVQGWTKGEQPVIQTDVTISSGTATKKSYTKPNLYQLEGKHKLVYHDKKSAWDVVVRTDVYPFLWLYYWTAFRTVASFKITKISLTTAWQQWKFEFGWAWESIKGLVGMTHDIFKSMSKAIRREWE